jgi:hypothetical protein
MPWFGPAARQGGTGRLVPLTLDGLIYASSMVMLDSAQTLTGSQADSASGPDAAGAAIAGIRPAE